MTGIVSYGSYIPYRRLKRAWIAPSPVFDEDSVSMAVEALRDALKTTPGAEVRSLIFGATTALYLEKLNARSLARRRNCRPTPPSSIRSNASGVSGGITNCPTSVHAASSN
jgi:3-hydroxy-3-methylglutaryl CoA synthase